MSQYHHLVSELQSSGYVTQLNLYLSYYCWGVILQQNASLTDREFYTMRSLNSFQLPTVYCIAIDIHCHLEMLACTSVYEQKIGAA